MKYMKFIYNCGANLFDVTCREIPGSSCSETERPLLKIDDNTYQFYDQLTHKFYEIKREFIYPSITANILNKMIYNVETKFEQQKPQISEEYEKYFEFHFTKFLNTTFQHGDNQGNHFQKYSNKQRICALK